jgi:hypothetical protein
VTSPDPLPPFRELTSERLRVREEHLLDRIRIEPRPHRRFPQLFPGRKRSLLAAAIVVSAVAAAPALAFSTTVRELVGLKETSSPPFLVATITGVTVHKPHSPALATVTVTFTVGEHGKSPGTGVPPGSDFELFLYGKTSSPGSSRLFISTNGTNGHYSATTLLPPGGIGSIQVGGWVSNAPGGAADGEFWLPVNAFRPGE